MIDELLKRAEAWVHDVRRTPLPLSASIDLVNALAARVRELGAENSENIALASRLADKFVATRAENEALRAAVEWYAEKARSFARYSVAKPPNTTAMMAVVAELTLDDGRRADAALAQGEKLC